MLTPTRSSMTFLQRAGIEPTIGFPLPTTALATMIANRVPLVPPLPKPEFLHIGEGQPPPDRGRTDVWPYGQDAQS